MAEKLLVATRASRLALKQVEELRAYFPKLKFKLYPLLSYGDKRRDISLLDDTPEDFFTRELDELLLKNKADIAVHSAKDLPYPLPDGLAVAALLPAKDQRDALVSKNDLPLAKLPKRARVGASSVLRRNELLASRPDLTIVAVRGTIEERLRKVAVGEIDALVVAVCALERLGLSDCIAEILPFAVNPLQGHLAVVARGERRDLRKIFSAVDMRRDFGRVTLVGGGPGDPLLLTRQAELCLQQADIIFYDDLTKNILAQTDYPGEKIYVGKRKGRHSHTQTEICERLYQAAKSGKQIARLKGGDPFIFGRGGEEMEYLQRRLIEVSVVPGISSGLAAAACSLIPLSRRDCAASIAFCAGHPLESMTVPDADTLVYYMAGTVLAAVAKKIMQAGRAPDLPAACIASVSCPAQSIIKTTLGELKKLSFAEPVILIVGAVVRRGNLPQISRTLFTGTDRWSQPWQPYTAYQPLIEIRPLAAYRRADKIIAQKYDWLIFTSKHAVKYFFERLRRLGRDARSLADTKIAVVGKITARVLAGHGLAADLRPAQESAAELLQLLKGLRGQKILLPGSNLALPVLYQGLRKQNKVTRLVLYRNVCPKIKNKIDLRSVDKVIFTAPSTVYNFRKIYRKIPKHLDYAVSGPTTAEALKRAKI